MVNPNNTKMNSTITGVARLELICIPVILYSYKKT